MLNAFKSNMGKILIASLKEWKEEIIPILEEGGFIRIVNNKNNISIVCATPEAVKDLVDKGQLVIYNSSLSTQNKLVCLQDWKNKKRQERLNKNSK